MTTTMAMIQELDHDVGDQEDDNHDEDEYHDDHDHDHDQGQGLVIDHQHDVNDLEGP